MKIACIALCKNELANIAPLLANLESFGVSDVFVLDTGSTDGSIQMLAELPQVRLFQKEFHPFDFAKARNHLRDCVPDSFDFYLHLDFDERIEKMPNLEVVDGNSCLSGRRKEAIFGTLSSNLVRITRPRNYRYVFPVHEQIETMDPIIHLDDFLIIHKQIPQKDRYERMTEAHFSRFEEHLFYHYCQDLFREKKFDRLCAIFAEKISTPVFVKMPEQQKWQITRNYQIGLMHLGRPPDPALFSIFEDHPSESSCLLLAIFLHHLGDKAGCRKQLERSVTATDASLNEIFFDRLVKQRARERFPSFFQSVEAP